MRLPIFSALALLAASSACEKPRLINVLPPDVRIDTYQQQAASKIDVLWVIDNSGSMAPRQENLARNFNAFIETFTKNNIDYRLAVTTSDIFRERGAFVGNPKVISPMTPNAVLSFAANVRVGITGSPYEAVLEAGRLSIEKQKAANVEAVTTCKNGCASNKPNCPSDCETKTVFPFLRDDAYLYLIFITDEEDRSEQDVRYYYRYFETAKGIGNDGTVTTAAIMGDVPSNSCGATPGERLKAMSELTGGEVGSICDDSFAATLKKLANNAVGLKRKFALQVAPNVKTIAVRVRYPCNTTNTDALRACSKVDRTACMDAPVDSMNVVCTPVQGGPDGWAYEPANKVVFFAGESVPGLNSQVELQYYEEGKEP